MKQHVENLINFEIIKNTIDKRDYIYVKNQLYHLLNIEHDDLIYIPKTISHPASALNPILDILEANNTLDGSNTARDLFDAKIMNIFTMLPSQIQQRFDDYKNSKAATSWLYDYSKNVNYIRFDRILKNISFEETGKYGDLQITINLSKPEKDPKSIALAGKIQSTEYPKCVLCKENEGFAGNFKRDSRDQHRLIKFDLLGEPWYFQFSPYIYYNEHAIVFSSTHKPMKISDKTFLNLLTLTERFDGYFFGSNADLPIVGGSILSHEHYQGGKHIFPIEKTNDIASFMVNDTKLSILNWPLSTIRLRNTNKNKVVELASKIFNAWKNYSNEALDIRAYTNDTPHHTITPIARKKDGIYELDLILRDNQTSDLHPLGIYHPHSDKWNIKKENIGLIEAIGLAILPGRLVDEMKHVKNYLLNDTILVDPYLKHKQWADSFKDKVTKDNIDDLLNKEIAKTFEAILEDCGVFKLNNEGINAFKQFINEVTIK